MKSTGTVKWFDDNRGYGLIRQDAGGRDVGVHYSAIAGEGYRSLSEGDAVEYDLVDGPGEYRAVNVRRIASTY
jgi:CspA family cold shock protein